MRNPLYDNLRGFAFILLFIAHTMSYSFWYNLREFDVPLMVFVSGLAYSCKEINNYRQWIVRRFKRLYYPILIFLSIFFAVSCSIKSNIYSLEEIAASFLMVGGIGYLWIFRIFIYIMILTPLLLWISKRLNSVPCLFLLTLITLIIQEILFWIVGINIPIARITIYYALGYSLVYLWGVNANKLIALVVLMPFFYLYSDDCTSWLGSGEKAWYNLEHEKYPPHSYFIIYGIVCSTFIYMLIRNFPFFYRQMPIVSFLGRNTCWIYLWHIVFLYLFLNCDFYNAAIWQIKFVILLTAATMTYHVQYVMITFLKRKYKLEIFKYLIG